MTVHKVCAVSDMDAVCLNLRRLGCAGQLDGLHDMFNAPRYAGGGIITNLFVDFLFQWGFMEWTANHAAAVWTKTISGD